MTDNINALHVPAQTIPAPDSLSPQAKAYLDQAAKRLADAAASGAPVTVDVEHAAEVALAFLRPAASRFDGTIETVDLPGGAKPYRAVPEGLTGRRADIGYFDIHGGGFVAGGGEMCKYLAQIRAAEYGVPVFAIDYRLAPQHRYPVALDDCMAAYREVLQSVAAPDLVVAGASAGGNLAAALMLRAVQEGLPLPVALLLQTPALDLTCAGDTSLTNRYLDVALYGRASDVLSAYAGDADRTDPLLSPLFGPIGKSWPPTLLSSGTRDLLLSDTVRMHCKLREAGVDAALYVTEAGPHGGFMGTAPEDHYVMGECKRFIYDAWGISA